MDGEWRTIIDPYETGYYDYRYQPSKDGYFKNAKLKDLSDRVEYDFDRSPTLQVPGDWNSQRESLRFYEGTIWYKISFDLEPRGDARLFLYFGAANYKTHVFLNGELVGEHEGGFTPFNFEVTDRVLAKDNVRVVKVDNKRLRDGVPTLQTDWWNYGGLSGLGTRFQKLPWRQCAEVVGNSRGVVHQHDGAQWLSAVERSPSGIVDAAAIPTAVES